jgi:hypothetical protein
MDVAVATDVVGSNQLIESCPVRFGLAGALWRFKEIEQLLSLLEQRLGRLQPLPVVRDKKSSIKRAGRRSHSKIEGSTTKNCEAPGS